MIDEIDKYNKMLKKEYGEDITVKIKNYIEDGGSKVYYFSSVLNGDSESFKTVREAYDYACMYLEYQGF